MKIICAGDFHLPHENAKALAVFVKHLGREKWDALVLGGDFLDFSYLSKYSIGNLRSIEGKRILNDYNIANKLLDKFDKIHKGKKYFIIGNHDDRVRKYIDANPNLEGMVELVPNLKLKERGYKIIEAYPKGEILELDKFIFTHGIYHNQFHTKKTLDAFDKNVIYFHTHTFQQFTKNRYDKTSKFAQAVGCMCDYDQDYMGKKPSSWQMGFVEIKSEELIELKQIIL
jgi:predicted phosphodiesterase